MNLKPSSLRISSSPNTIAFDTLAPKAKFLDCKSSFSFHEPNVLALQTSFTKEVDEKSIIDSAGSFLWTGWSKSTLKETLKPLNGFIEAYASSLTTVISFFTLMNFFKASCSWRPADWIKKTKGL